jgi:hypothetical protein
VYAAARLPGLAARILTASDDARRARLDAFRDELATKVRDQDAKLRDSCQE